MSKHENLIYQLEDLESILDGYLDVLNEDEIDETDYEQIVKGMNSVLGALKGYFDEKPGWMQELMV